ncbi:MAG: hypothetical protein JXR97_00875, partial [Planctomycetes bacterium]|nr:hypothetical protein [Planctomycetota bacterium]
MSELTGRERIHNILNSKSVDHYPVYEHFWPETKPRWVADGMVKEEDDLTELCKLDLRMDGWFNSIANLDFEPEVIAETEDTITVLDGNGATLKRHKKHSATPEHIAFSVEEREDWEEKIKPFLLDVDRRRINFESYRNTKATAAAQDEYFCWNYVAPFEQMHPVCGHEFMLMGMAEDPDWIKDMVNTFVNFTINHAEVLFAEEGKPDGVWFYEDMGFKEKPFMSPAMYRELVQPGHKRLFDWAHSKGLKVIVHSCGFVEPLVPGMIEAGMDCLQAIEVKAGMDVVRLAEKFGDKIS